MRAQVLWVGLSAALLVASTTAPAGEAGAMERPAAAADAYDTYSEEIFATFVGRADGQDWSGACKRGYWLDARAGSPGQSMGRGFIVWTQPEVPVLVVEYPWERITRDGYVARSAGRATNFDPFYERFVRITMVCTNDPAHLWAG